MIDPQSYEVLYEEPDDKIESIDALLEELPDNSPRFVVLSYSKTLDDGRLSNPLVLVYHRPLTAKQDAKMLYAGCLEQFKGEVSANRFVEVADEDDWDALRAEVDPIHAFDSGCSGAGCAAPILCHVLDKYRILTVQGKGISSSAIPYSRNVPSWFKLSSEDVVEQIIKYARKGLTPSQIGVILRDAHGVNQAKVITGNKILRILKSNGLAPEIPEDLYYLIKKAVSVRKHLERNRKDKDSKFRLILIESRIHRLARYYRTVAVLPPTWKYESATASALVN
ncbi:hypothetical protein KL910_000654 [Ogataea haglerorum]|nr:hypothetical protein KL945_003658 [Ogataea haglerorum]KAG7793959.1 hypothetical protein KL910_000654 [Ogataea haglerorum]